MQLHHLIQQLKICINLFQDKLKDARFVDATEGQNNSPDLGMTDQIDASTFINSRF
jgi:hypothetical protein